MSARARQGPPEQPSDRDAGGPPRTLLITAGPTHEPIDAVRFLGNRSSGRLGLALASAAVDRGWRATLLLGPVAGPAPDSRVEVVRFHTAEDLRSLLAEHAPRCDALVMAAAVADFRPARPLGPGEKLRRTGDRVTLELEPVPDLIAEAAAAKRPGQVFIGFALEPRDRLEASARDKLARKRLDAIVANPLETMDADAIEATLVHADSEAEPTGGPIPKAAFAGWLMDRLDRIVGQRGAAG